MAGANRKRPTAAESHARNKKSKTRSPVELDETPEVVDERQAANDEQDSGSDEGPPSQDMSILASDIVKHARLLTERDDWPKTFTAQVRKRQNALLAQIKQEGETIAAHRHAFTTHFARILAAALPPVLITPASTSTPKILITHLAPTPQPLHTKSSTLLSESKALLAQYTSLSTPHAPRSEPSRLEAVQADFVRDSANAFRSLSAGRRVAMVDIDHMLADHAGEVRGRVALTGEDEEIGRKMLAVKLERDLELELEKMAEGESWGETAKKMKRAFTRMAGAVEE